MFLKRFKVNSNQKYINNLLNSRQTKIHDNKIESVGIILNHDEFNNYDQLRFLLKKIGIKDNKVKFIAFIDDDKYAPNTWDSFFTPKNFGWKGKINNVELQDFIKIEFDAIISYYKADILELNMVTAMSAANLKIGISNSDHRLYDLIIDIETQHIEVFKNELIKYLKGLNKI